MIAPLQYDGTIDSSLFEAWFETRLPQAIPNNSVIVMDHASFRRKSRLFPLAEIAGMKLIFLPPYSPEYNYNRIENFWSWLKRCLCKILPAHTSFEDALCSAFQVC